MLSFVWDDCCPQTPRPSHWLESRSGGLFGCRSLSEAASPPSGKGRITNNLQLRIAHRIDIKLLRPAFEPHLIAEHAVHYSNCRVISDFRAVSVFCVCLF